ncbi:hypothetical protein MBLNU13_g09475t1 [Cladosporium sp. NU13]
MSPDELNHLPPILGLPIELREQIYDYLLELKNADQGSHPLPGVAVTSVSHAPPSSNLLLLHPTITTELLDRFYSQATCKTVISHAFNFFRTDPELRHLESSHALKRIQRVELVFFQDILLLKDYPSFGLESFCAEIRRRADRACDVFLQAPQLKSVTISWIDTTRIGGWAEKIHILEHLRKLKGRVNVSIGELKISGDQESQVEDLRAFKDAVEQAVGVPIMLPQHNAETQDDLRLLAFDIRQQPLHANMII